MFFVEFVFEPAEGSLALDSLCQPAPGALIGDSVGEVGHVLVPDPGRQRLDDDQVQFIEVDWRLPTVATDAANHTTSQAYDLDGNVISSTDQNNNTTKLTLDPRGDVIQVMAPHDTSGGTTTYNTTQYVYDQVGNRTQVLTPRAVAAGTSTASACVATQTCPFTYVTQYDADNRVSAQRSAYDPNDPTYNTPAVTTYGYDAAGRLKTVTAPSSGMPASGGPSATTYSYFDNNWVKNSTDPWNISTSYDYTNDGQ
jgi:YD repeat-containing protein